eukprot:NODE_152_length_16986_cov_0.478119.p3 type:complete len:484 gc:universal NODE_152_length_16986_cov_0.478119:4168-5619(+)
MQAVVLLACPPWLSRSHIPSDLRIITFGDELVTTINYKQIKLISLQAIEIIYQIYLILDTEIHNEFVVYIDIPLEYQSLLSINKMVKFKSPNECFFHDYLKSIHPSDRDLLEFCCDLLTNNDLEINALPLKLDIVQSLDINLLNCLLDYRRFHKYVNRVDHLLLDHEIDVPCYLSPVNTTYIFTLIRFTDNFPNRISFKEVSEVTDINECRLVKYQVTIVLDTLSVTSSDNYYLLRHALESAAKSMCNMIFHLLVIDSHIFQFSPAQKSKIIHTITPFDDFFMQFNHRLGYICDNSKITFEGARLVINQIESGFSIIGKTTQTGKSIDSLLQASMRVVNKTRFPNNKNLLFENYYSFFDFFPDESQLDVQLILFKDLLCGKRINCQIVYNKHTFNLPFKFTSKYDAFRYALLWSKPELVVKHFKDDKPWQRLNRPAKLPKIFERSGENYNKLGLKISSVFYMSERGLNEYDELFTVPVNENLS